MHYHISKKSSNHFTYYPRNYDMIKSISCNEMVLVRWTKNTTSQVKHAAHCISYRTYIAASVRITYSSLILDFDFLICGLKKSPSRYHMAIVKCVSGFVFFFAIRPLIASLGLNTYFSLSLFHRNSVGISAATAIILFNIVTNDRNKVTRGLFSLCYKTFAWS